MLLVSPPEILPDLVVRHTERRPIFVLGMSRSGTSLIAALLRKYLKVNFGTECQFVIDYYRRLARFGDLTQEPHFSFLAQEIAAERCFQRWRDRFGFQLDAARAAAEATAPTYPALLASIFEQFAAYHGMQRWGEKTPSYDSDAQVLLNLFPNARFIHMVRDGRDVALSGYRVFFGERNAYKAAGRWLAHIRAVRAFAATLPPDRLVQLRYEDLTTRPDETFARLIAFLEIDDGDGALQRYIASHIADDLHGHNTGKWKTAFSPRDLEVYEAVAGDTLSSLGYERAVRQPAALGVLPRLYYECHDKVTKWLDIEYQRDNAYRIKVRTRWATQRLRRLGRPFPLPRPAAES
jgi:hypothetical protein